MVFRVSTTYPIHQLRSEMDRLLGGWLPRASAGLWSVLDRGQTPVKIWQCGERLLVEAELPGVKPDRIDISVSGGELSIRAERPDEPPEGAIYHRRERPRGATERVLRLPVDVDTSKVEASLTDGILTISLPKAESAKPRKIPVAFNAPAESPPPGP